jgi:hypothetical protein
VVDHKKISDFCKKNMGKNSDVGGRGSENNTGGRAYEGTSNKAPDRDRTKFGPGRSSDSTDTGEQ